MQQSTGVTIRPFLAADLPAVVSLLEGAGLPLEGVGPSSLRLWVAEAEGRVVGAGGLETYGRHGLLRSVVVDPARRGEGVGVRLVEAVLAEARDMGLDDLFLLTTTAERWFPRWGFAEVAREGVPVELEGSEELKGACPASAVVMRRRIR